MWRAPEGPATVSEGGGRAWPGFETTRRAVGSRRGRLAGGPPPSGTHSGRARRCPEHPWDHKQQKQEDCRLSERQAARPSRARQAVRHTQRPGPTVPGTPAVPLIDARIQAERPASRVARWTPPRSASWAAWVRHEKPSARYTASGCADRDGSSECDATATDRS